VGVLGTERRIIVLALARMVDALGNSFLIVVLPLFVHSGTIDAGQFGLSEQLLTGIVLGLFTLVSSPLQPFVGNLSDRIGRRQIFVVVGLGILTLTNAAYTLVDGVGDLLVVRALQGLGVALTITTTLALVNEYSVADSRGSNMGLFNTFRLFGFGAGPVIAGVVVSHGPYAVPAVGPAQLSGFEAAFYLASLGAMIGAVLVTVFVADPDELTAEAGGELSIAVFADDERLLDPVFTLGLASFFMALCIAFLEALEPTVNARLNQGPTLFGIEFGMFVLAQMLVQWPIGRLSDTYGRKPFLVGGLALLIPATVAQGLVLTPEGMLVARFAQGVAAAAVFAPALTLAGDLTRMGESGTKLSVLTMAFGFGLALGPMAAGYLVRFGFVTPFALGSVLAACGLVLVYTQVEETVVRGADDGLTESTAI
jgi:MFS family permease